MWRWAWEAGLRGEGLLFAMRRSAIDAEAGVEPLGQEGEGVSAGGGGKGWAAVAVGMCVGQESVEILGSLSG